MISRFVILLLIAPRVPGNDCNCTTTEYSQSLVMTSEIVGSNETATARPRTLEIPNRNWNDLPRLKFPKTIGEDRYGMASLKLDKGWFLFDFLRGILIFVLPYDVPLGLIKDILENRLSVEKLISEHVHLEAALIGIVGISCLLACVIPVTEFYLACRPLGKGYKPTRHPRRYTFLLTIFVSVYGICVLAMLICNESIDMAIRKLPTTVDVALRDLNDYHTSTTVQLRKSLTRSLDVAGEAILADLDNVEDLLGKPVQSELASETGVDVAIEALLDVANISLELSNKAEIILQGGESIQDSAIKLSGQVDQIRHDLENSIRSCGGSDRSLCAVVDPNGLRSALRIDRLLRDDRLLRLRATSQENLTNVARESRSEYFYVPDRIARNTLEIRNQIRLELDQVRGKINEGTRGLEDSKSQVSRRLDTVKNTFNRALPHVMELENMRWLVGLGTVMGVLPAWSLLLVGLFCRCGTNEGKVRPLLLCNIFFTCFLSIALWGIFLAALALAGHTDALLCRPLHEPEFHTLETVLESKVFLDRRLTVPLKDFIEKCKKNESAYPTIDIEGTTKIDQLTAHWSWSGLTKSISKLKVDLKGLRIFTPGLQQRLQNLLHACGSNLTEHRNMIQGPISSTDLTALSDQLDNVARQMSDRSTAKTLQNIGSRIRDVTNNYVKPLMKLQDELVYRLTVLELQLQPLQRQVNQSISHLKTIQYYIENQGEQIAKLKTKTYTDRLVNYLDQWRSHVLSEIGMGVSKCRPVWDILEGFRFLVCQHIVGSMDGYWFAIFVCLLGMMGATPMTHVLSLVYRRETVSKKDIGLLPQRSESPDTVVMDRETWQTPEPPPLPDDGW